MYDIKLDDLSSTQVIHLLEEHLADMQATSPPESKHALDLNELKSPLIKFWTLWQGDKLAGFAAYKKLSNSHAEIKSMRTSQNYKKQGVASILLKHIIHDAQQCGFQKLSLETGSMDYFKPAHSLYKKHGFSFGQPFSNYIEDENSLFMHLALRVQ